MWVVRINRMCSIHVLRYVEEFKGMVADVKVPSYCRIRVGDTIQVPAEHGKIFTTTVRRLVVEGGKDVHSVSGSFATLYALGLEKADIGLRPIVLAR